MYLVVVGWLYVVMMMVVAEAMSPTGSILGAIVTFFLRFAAGGIGDLPDERPLPAPDHAGP